MLKQNSGSLRIGVDLMGHDNAPEVLLKALHQLSQPPHIQILAIGTSEYERIAPPLQYQVAAEVIEMSDSPLKAVRSKKNSSLCVGLRLLKDKKIDVFISAGNTGALVSASKIILGMKPHFTRPALLTLMPTKKKPLAVLDVGANSDIKASHYVQFALLGAEYQRAQGIEKPVVGLLNIGSEPTKGRSELRLAYKELKALTSAPFVFAGNIEGTAAFEGEIDVLVTDGFTGNIFLKTSEGIANLLLDQLSTHIPQEVLHPFMKTLKQQISYAEYPGAILAGVQGAVIKCHGYSTVQSFASAIHMASKTFKHCKP